MSSDESQDEAPERSRSRLPLLMIGGVVILAAAFLGGRALAPFVGGGRPAPAKETAREAPRPAPPAVSQPATPATAEPAPEPKARPRKKAEPVPAPAAPPAAPTTGELHISSDVPGAMVFLDRVYLGAAPVTATNVAPGRHHLNVSAEGHEGYSETIEVAPGTADVVVRFNEIRLAESVDVVHKHGLGGSCEGRLLADPQGVRYDTANKSDAFSLKFADIEAFQVDYLKKNLRIKQRGSKTWNFTTKAENADPLFVFHRNVDKVRLQATGARTK